MTADSSSSRTASPAPPEWPVAFFDDDYLRIYRPMFSKETTDREIAFLDGALALPPGAELLDLACGCGRHAIAMAKRGYQVTGVDFNAHYLEIAASDARAAKAEVHWQVADMRALPFEADFDGVYSYFTSFGYFSDAENEQVLGNVARALRPHGRFLLDMMNRDWLITHPQQRVWHQREDGSLLMEEITLDLSTSRVLSRQMLIEPEGGVRLAKSFDLRAYTCAELRALLARQGMAVKEVWGGPDRTAYSTESRRLVLLAEKTA